MGNSHDGQPVAYAKGARKAPIDLVRPTGATAFVDTDDAHDACLHAGDLEAGGV